MNLIKRVIYIYNGRWKHQNLCDMPKRKDHKRVQVRHMTKKQINKLIGDNK
jgi:hypothetical protein